MRNRNAITTRLIRPDFRHRKGKRYGLRPARRMNRNPQPSDSYPDLTKRYSNSKGTEPGRLPFPIPFAWTTWEAVCEAS
jgi:hypothetical protein